MDNNTHSPIHRNRLEHYKEFWTLPTNVSGFLHGRRYKQSMTDTVTRGCSPLKAVSVRGSSVLMHGVRQLGRNDWLPSRMASSSTKRKEKLINSRAEKKTKEIKKYQNRRYYSFKENIILFMNLLMVTIVFYFYPVLFSAKLPPKLNNSTRVFKECINCIGWFHGKECLTKSVTTWQMDEPTYIWQIIPK